MSLSFCTFLDSEMPGDLPILKIANLKLYTIDAFRCTPDQMRLWIERVEDANPTLAGGNPHDVLAFLRENEQYRRFNESRNVTETTKGELRATSYLRCTTPEVLASAKRAGYLKDWQYGYRQVIRADAPLTAGEIPQGFSTAFRIDIGSTIGEVRGTSKTASPRVKDVRYLFGLAPVSGMFGIEIEVEGSRFPLVPAWEKKTDGSLRGESAEYVLSTPLDKEPAVEALKTLSKAFKDNDTVRNYSYRTSVHVHVNVQAFKRNRLNVFLYLANLFEDALINYAGPSRLGNRFCLSNSTSMGNTQELESFVKSRDMYCPSMDRAKYMAINMSSLNRFGSIEFRMMEGTDDVERISTWLSILEDLYKASDKWDTIKDVAAFIEKEGFRKLFIKSITLKNRKILSAGFDVEASLLDAYKRLILVPHKEVKYD